jgi:hypothetical protein
MLEEDLLMEASVARKLRLIADDPILNTRAHVHALPASWGTLYELHKLKPELLQALIEDGTINSKMSREEAIALRKPGARSVPPGCPVCRETANVPAGHEWTEDDIEGQSSTQGFVDDLIAEIQRIFGGTKNRQKHPTLRQKIEHVRNARVHPSIRAALAHALTEHAAIATRLAKELRSPVIDRDADEVGS